MIVMNDDQSWALQQCSVDCKPTLKVESSSISLYQKLFYSEMCTTLTVSVSPINFFTTLTDSDYIWLNHDWHNWSYFTKGLIAARGKIIEKHSYENN